MGCRWVRKRPCGRQAAAETARSAVPAPAAPAPPGRPRRPPGLGSFESYSVLLVLPDLARVNGSLVLVGTACAPLLTAHRPFVLRASVGIGPEPQLFLGDRPQPRKAVRLDDQEVADERSGD